MKNYTERINILVTPNEKRKIARMAAQGGVSVGELLRRAVFSCERFEYDPAFEILLDQVNRSTHRTITILDDAIEKIDASNKRIKALDARLASSFSKTPTEKNHRK